MEAHVFTQLEFPGCIIKRLPRSRQRRNQFLIIVLRDERLKDVTQHAIVRADIVIMRIHRSDCRLQANRNIAGMGGLDWALRKSGICKCH